MNINQQIQEIETLEEYHVISNTLTNLFIYGYLKKEIYTVLRKQLLTKFKELIK